jgi:hypothetical protein
MMRKDAIEEMLNLTPLEQEIITLKAVADMIGDMVNHEVMTIHFSDPDSSIMFKSITHMAFFNIILVDLLSRPSGFFTSDRSYFDRLEHICANPLMGKLQAVKELTEAVCTFARWLSEEVTVQNRWFPSLNLQIDLKITRKIFIGICGNIAKHNFTQLTRQADRLRKIFCANSQGVSIDRCILALQDFRQQFYNDVFQYHSSTIAEFLNNIRWGIHSYAAMVRESCTETRFDEKLQLSVHEYRSPRDVTSELGKACFWELMNSTMQQPYVRRFKVAPYLKMRY